MHMLLRYIRDWCVEEALLSLHLSHHVSLSQCSDKVKQQLITILKKKLPWPLHSMRKATNQEAPSLTSPSGWVTRQGGLPARRRWHVRAACCRRTGAPVVIKCIYLREGLRGPVAWHWSSKWPRVIVIHHCRGVGTEEKHEGRGKTKETSWPFPPHIHTYTPRPSPSSAPIIHKYL